MRRVWIAAVVSLLVMAPVCSAQTGAATPEDVARQMLTLTRAGDWPGYAKLLHPEALVAFQKMFREIVAGDDDRGQPSVTLDLSLPNKVLIGFGGLHQARGRHVVRKERGECGKSGKMHFPAFKVSLPQASC